MLLFRDWLENVGEGIFFLQDGVGWPVKITKKIIGKVSENISTFYCLLPTQTFGAGKNIFL